MQRLQMLLLILSLAACAATRNRPVAQQTRARARDVPTLQGICAETSLVVVPQKGSYQYGLDPVETQRLVLHSRTFRAMLARSRPGMAGARYRVRREGKSAIVKIVAAGTTRDEAMRTCEALGSLALSNDDPSMIGDDASRSWLAEQREILQGRKDEADRQLQEFRKANNLVVLSLADRMSMARTRLMDLMRARDRAPKGKRRDDLEKAIDATRSELLEMSTLELTFNRLGRAADNASHMLETVLQREGALGLDRMLDRRLRLLDRCAPADCI